MTRILVTGASGYIGSRLCALVRGYGFDVVALGHGPRGDSSIEHFDWRLGEELPHSALKGAIAVIHLAHSWTSDIEAIDLDSNLNLTGSLDLARRSLTAGVPKFVFASSVSSRPDALNTYGRIKNLTEGRLGELPDARSRIMIARIGLVYGGPESGLYGLLSKLVRSLPVLPMIGLNRQVQPIHVDEVARGLVTMATQPVRQPEDTKANTFILAAAKPVSFANWLRELRQALTGKSLRFIPVPIWLALLGCKLTSIIPFVPRIDRERVLGLVGTIPIRSEDSLDSLHLDLVSPQKQLARLRAPRRRCVAEATAMLRYVAGRRSIPTSAVVHLIRGIRRYDRQPLGLPSIVISCPPLLRFIDPGGSSVRNRLAECLHLASLVADATGTASRSLGFLRLMMEALLEGVAFPFRTFLGRRYQ